MADYGYRYFKGKEQKKSGEFIASVVATIILAVMMYAVIFLFTLTS